MPDPMTRIASLTEVACWTHVPRGIYEVYEATASPLAQEALERIAELFAIDEGIKGLSPSERLAAASEMPFRFWSSLRPSCGRRTTRSAARASLRKRSAMRCHAGPR
jgi:transposase